METSKSFQHLGKDLDDWEVYLGMVMGRSYKRFSREVIAAMSLTGISFEDRFKQYPSNASFINNTHQLNERRQ